MYSDKCTVTRLNNLGTVHIELRVNMGDKILCVLVLPSLQAGVWRTSRYLENGNLPHHQNVYNIRLFITESNVGSQSFLQEVMLFKGWMIILL